VTEIENSTDAGVIDHPEEQSEKKLRGRLKPLEEKIASLGKKLDHAEAELSHLIEDKEKYKLLDEIGERLETLIELGGGHLLWGEECTEEESARNFERIKQTVGHYDDLLATRQTARDEIAREIHECEIEAALIHDEIVLQQILEEERKYEFVPDREFRILPYRQMDMPWYVQGEDEKRFRKYLLIAAAACIVLGIIIPLIHISKPEFQAVEIPERLAKMIEEKKPQPPKPKEETPRPSEERPSEKATEQEKQVARKKAEQTGLMAFKDNFTDLMDTMDDTKLGAEATISNAGSKAAQTQRSIVTAAASSASGGISSSSVSRDTGTAGQEIGGFEFSRVSSAIGTDFEQMETAAAGSPSSRSDEDIQIVFDRYKAALYRVYNRELRTNPTLRGRMVLKITIQPTGVVSACVVDSSDMNAPSLEAKIIERVKTFNFGAKEGANVLTILYPIDFLPAS